VVFPREVLDEIKWHQKAWVEAEVTYVHRGAPGDVMTISGGDLTALGRSFFEVGDSSSPYHRIVEIALRNNALFRATAAP